MNPSTPTSISSSTNSSSPPIYSRIELYISGKVHNLKEEEVKKFFEQYGTVQRVFLNNKKYEDGNGFGFVHLSEDSKLSEIMNTFQLIKDTSIKLVLSNKNDPHIYDKYKIPSRRKSRSRSRSKSRERSYSRRRERRSREEDEYYRSSRKRGTKTKSRRSRSPHTSTSSSWISTPIYSYIPTPSSVPYYSFSLPSPPPPAISPSASNILSNLAAHIQNIKSTPSPQEVYDPETNNGYFYPPPPATISYPPYPYPGTFSYPSI